jgi:glycine/D-amino acid oxidase-like deaminating enzyme
VKTWDAIIVGGGVIGLSLAWKLKAHRLNVLVVEKQEPAREATYAAGGMIASCDPNIPLCLRPLVDASAQMYPTFVHELQDEAAESVDLRNTGTIAYLGSDDTADLTGSRRLTETELRHLEPLLKLWETAWLLPERSVDPRALGQALIKAAKHRPSSRCLPRTGALVASKPLTPIIRRASLLIVPEPGLLTFHPCRFPRAPLKGKWFVSFRRPESRTTNL